jgi:hypothetical protein
MVAFSESIAVTVTVRPPAGSLNALPAVSPGFLALPDALRIQVCGAAFEPPVTGFGAE